MSRLEASAISWSSFSACRNSRGLPTDGAREAVHVLEPIHLLLDGLPQHRIVGDLENEQRFRDLPEGLQHPIEGVLFRVRVEPAKQVRSRHFLEFDGCDHAQDFIPLLKHNLVIRTASGLDLPTDGGEKVCPAKVSRNG